MVYFSIVSTFNRVFFPSYFTVEQIKIQDTHIPKQSLVIVKCCPEILNLSLHEEHTH